MHRCMASAICANDQYPPFTSELVWCILFARDASSVQRAPFVKPHCVLITAAAAVLLIKRRPSHTYDRLQVHASMTCLRVQCMAVVSFHSCVSSNPPIAGESSLHGVRHMLRCPLSIVCKLACTMYIAHRRRMSGLYAKKYNFSYFILAINPNIRYTEKAVT